VERRFDIVLFGATGFTGALAAEYLLGHAPPGARLALAARRPEKLEALVGGLGSPAVELIVADVNDPDSIEALARSTRVVASTVGPYLSFGEPLVAACAAAGTDYVDLTGESEFVDLMYLRYHQQARETGARLVHSCGYDSIPFDLGALFTVSQLAAPEPLALQGFGRADGSISGGTLRSLVGVLARFQEAGRVARQRRAIERHAADGMIAEGRTVRSGRARVRREPLAGGWVIPAPLIDAHHVLRTARLNTAYGPDFTYAHHIVTGRLSRTLAIGAGLPVLLTMAQFGPTRRLVLAFRGSGEGPSAERRARSHFTVTFIAEHGPAAHRRRLVTSVSGGDPGYDETAKMLSESALALAFDDDLPARGGGQLTPALALGQPLIRRLQRAGIRFEVLSDER
jgi:short subunit dehydrogenase-like uncharacterized protein